MSPVLAKFYRFFFLRFEICWMMKLKFVSSPAFFAGDGSSGAASDHYLEYLELKKDTKVLNQVQKGRNDNFDKNVKKGQKMKKPDLEIHQNKFD